MNFIDAIREVCPKTTVVIEIIGALILLRKIFTFISRIYKLMLRKRKNLKKRYGANSWAFITGSSDGIGKALALSFAKQGFNIILSARTAQKLQQVQKTIKQKYPTTEVKILVADYKRAIDWGFTCALMDEISQLDISIVVNNVGVDIFDKYLDLDPKTIQDLIALNCYPVAFINRYFLPIFKKRTQRTGKKCVMVNIASIAGTMPMSYYSVYSASKAYVDRLSLSLAYENPQIDIISIRPSQVSTPMTHNKQLDIFTIKAEDCSEGILNQLGHDRMSYGHWRHKLQGWLYQAIPEKLFMFIFEKVFVPEQMKSRKRNR